MTGMRRELLSLIESWEIRLPRDFDDDTPLISSGAIDSLVLFRLLLWVEEKTGHPVDPGAVDLVARLDSVRLILGYVQASAPAGAARGDERRARSPAPHAANIRVIQYAPQHKAAVAELQTGLWSPDPALNRAYLEWKYESNPYGSEPRIYLALDRDELVGMRGFYPSRWEAGSPAKVVDVLVADDLLLRPDHRNEGLTTRIMRAALDDLRGSGSSYLFNLSAGHVATLNSLAMGWRSAGSLVPVGRVTMGRRARMTIRRVVGWLPLSWRYANSAPLATARTAWHYAVNSPLATGFALELFSNIDRHLGPHRMANGVTVHVEAGPRSQEMAALVARRAHDGRLRHVRDQAFFDWRFRNPRNEYRFLFVGSGTLEGYLVLMRTRTIADARPRVNIVDLEADDPRIRSALLEAAIQIGRFRELAIWTATRDPGLRTDLTHFAFSPIDQELARLDPCILVRPVDEAQPPQDWILNGVRLLDLGNWDMRMIFSMAG